MTGTALALAPDMGTKAGQSAHYAAVHDRLMRLPRPRAIQRVTPPVVTLPAPPEPILPDPVEPMLGSCPLNMLAPPSWRFLVALAALRGGVVAKDILSPSRARPVAKARHDAVALVFSHGYRSLLAVGRIFDRHHTTILHSVRKMGAKQLPPEPDIPQQSTAPKAKSPGRPPTMLKVRGTGRRPTALQNAVRRAYLNGVPPSVLAEEYGCSTKSVKVIAWRMGLARKPSNSTARMAQG